MGVSRAPTTAPSAETLSGLHAYTLATGRLFSDISSFHEYAEELAQRPILTHEFADEALWAELRAEFESRAKEILS